MKRNLIRLLSMGLALSLAAACGSSDDDGGALEAPDDQTTETTETTGPVEVDAFPVTIDHAFGETEIAEAPERVVTWGWATADAAIALGTVPVAITFQEYGADEEGVVPWIREALEAEGAEVPTVLPNSEEPPFEAIAAAQPDLILATYSGITEQDYELLSAIAPTVAYPDQAWSTPWRDVIEITGRALGRSEAAAAVLADIDDQIAAAAAAHPELAGKTVAMVWDAAGTFYVYKPADPRVEFAQGLGLVSAPSVEELATDEATFYFTLSYENVDQLDSDILVSFAETDEASATFLASPQAQLMAQVREGRVAEVIGAPLVAAVSPPTALSLTWGLDEYVEILSAAAAVVDG